MMGKHIDMTSEQCEKFLNFIMGDDLDFYEEYIIDLTDEEQNKFFSDNSDFMSEFPVSRDRMYLLRDEMLRKILRRIKQYEDKNECKE